MTEFAQCRDPLFVVGMNGSGTTMLLDNMSRHPELYAFPRESRIIPWLIASVAALGDLKDDDNFYKLWRMVIDQHVFEYENGNERIGTPANWREYSRDLKTVLNWVFGYFAAKEGKTRWCEKTPHYVQHIEKLAELFPGAKFIHMIRDGRDCAASFHRRWGRTPQLTVFRWKKVLQEGRQQAAAISADRYMEVHYEDLTTETEQWLNRICDFLDVPFDPAVLESSQPYLKGMKNGNDDAVPGTLVPNSGKWRDYFSARQIGKLESIAGKTLHTFEYPTEQPDADRDLSTFVRRAWTLKDNAAQFAKVIGLKLRGNIDRPWSVIMSRPIVSMRQRKHNRY